MATIACNDVCRESKRISSSQNFLFTEYNTLLKQYELLKVRDMRASVKDQIIRHCLRDQLILLSGVVWLGTVSSVEWNMTQLFCNRFLDTKVQN
jgi:hypothetical protein